MGKVDRSSQAHLRGCYEYDLKKKKVYFYLVSLNTQSQKSELKKNIVIHYNRKLLRS